MIIDSVLAQIDAEIAKLTQVRALLATTGKVADKITTRIAKKAGRPAKAAKATKAAKPAKTRKRRVLSAEARQRIADAQLKRWAAQKKKA